MSKHSCSLTFTTRTLTRPHTHSHSHSQLIPLPCLMFSHCAVPSPFSGFVVLAFPSDQFGGQEPGSNDQIENFACSRYKASFPMSSVRHSFFLSIYQSFLGGGGERTTLRLYNFACSRYKASFPMFSKVSGLFFSNKEKGSKNRANTLRY